MSLIDLPLEAGWRPIPGTSQERAISSPCHHTLFTGARGPGKTDTQLHYFRKYVGMGYGAFWRGVIFDREYKSLDDLISKSKRWFYQYNDGAIWLTAKSDYLWKWPTGEELLIRAIKEKDEYWKYHGQEFPFIGWNELCKYPTLELYDMLMSCNRSSFTPEVNTPQGRLVRESGEVIYDRKEDVLCKPIPLRVFSTTNPYGVGHNAVKRRFIIPKPYGVPVVRKAVVYDPKTKQDVEVQKTQVAIFGSWRENIYLSPEYIMELTENENENMRKAWAEGDWDIVAGGAIDDIWSKRIHVIPQFKVPKGEYIDRVLDWGSSEPFHVAWWLEATGEEYHLLDGKGVFAPRAGSLICINEWYGTKEIGTNKGLKLSAKQVAEGVRDEEIRMLHEGWIKEQPEPGPADNQIRNVNEVETDTIEKKMADVGILWEPSDKSTGSRIVGLQLFRDRLSASKRREGEAVYFMDNCIASIDILPSLPRDEKRIDDIDTDAEDHVWDSCRYRMLKGNNRYVKDLNVDFAT